MVNRLFKFGGTLSGIFSRIIKRNKTGIYTAHTSRTPTTDDVEHSVLPGPSLHVSTPTLRTSDKTTEESTRHLSKLIPRTISNTANEDNPSTLDSFIESLNHSSIQNVTDFEVMDVYYSLEEEARVNLQAVVDDWTATRKAFRRKKLLAEEREKQTLLHKLSIIEFDIAKNNEWFFNIASRNNPISESEHDTHRRQAENLYTQKRELTTSLIPSVEDNLSTINAELLDEKRLEAQLRAENFIRQLRQIHKENIAYEAEKAKTEKAIERERKAVAQRIEFVQEQERSARKLAREKREQAEIRQRERENECIRRQEEIIGIIERRQIKTLLHFTPQENLSSILSQGLNARMHLSHDSYIFTDDHRADGWLEWISVSISFPNYRMFYTKRINMKNVSGWVVISLSTRILYELECKFLPTNAASSSVHLFDEQYWSSSQAFEYMFTDDYERKDIPDNYPTDPQAEVMVKDNIDQQYIQGIFTHNDFHARMLQKTCRPPVTSSTTMFSGRQDYQYWAKRRIDPFLKNTLVAAGS